MKRYRIRKLSIAWWFTRVVGTVLALAGCYACILLADALVAIGYN